jgi:hypothetical protein
MVAKFQWAVTFFLKIFFSISFLRHVRVENGKKLWKKFLSFSQDGATRPRLVRIGFSTITSKVLIFFSICFFALYLYY